MTMEQLRQQPTITLNSSCCIELLRLLSAATTPPAHWQWKHPRQ